MNFSENVSVSRRFQRAIRIDLDIDSPSALDGYICPQSSADILISMVHQVSKTGQGAFTWTGPYGSGKSSLVVTLAALLSGDARSQKLARTALGTKTSKEVLKCLSADSKPWTILPVVGRRELPEQVLAEALFEKGLIPKLKANKSATVLQAIQELVAGRKSKKLFIFVDEMGKFLESAAQDGRDIYFFQELAELASRSNGRLILVGVLHQAFEEYASKISRGLRDEWAKIQGRFIDLPLNIAGEEQLELLSRAIQVKTVHAVLEYKSLCKVVEDNVRTNKPSFSPRYKEILSDCWPLHPVTAGLLGPISRRRFGQNQRSVFGFLNSAEPFGFQEFLKAATAKEALYRPDMLWDYLKANLEPSIMASPDGHRWAQALVALDRAESKGLSEQHIVLVKTIAIIDLLRETSGISATEEVLASCFPDYQRKIKSLLKDLTNASAIILRKFLSAYSVFAGSDFDIEKALSEAMFEIDKVDFRFVQNLVQTPPIMAKRHYRETGALRWFDVDICALSDLKSEVNHGAPLNGAMGRFILTIPTEGEPKEKAHRICREAARIPEDWYIAAGVCDRGAYIHELAKELLAIRRVQDTNTELSGDEVARKEVDVRFSFVAAQLEKELQKAFNASTWYVKHLTDRAVDYIGLNRLASDLADKQYNESPRIQNELLNRTKPSSNAVAAQKALLRQMVLYEGDERLKIEGFPPEGGLFISILEATELYKKVNGQWCFAEPDPQSHARLFYIWEQAKKLLKENADKTVSVQEIYEIWKKPPFGVRDGLLPVLIVSFLLSNVKHLAFYRDGIFQARFKDLEVDYLTNEPSSIQLRWMNLSTFSRQLLSEMASVVRDLDPDSCLQNEEPIDVARALIGLFDQIPPWVHRTSRLTKNAIKIRDLFKKANDPNKFLFDDIPALFEQEISLDQKRGITDLVEKVKDGLSELITAYPTALESLKVQMYRELHVVESQRGLKELRERAIDVQELENLHDRAENIQNLSGDFILEAFISRVARFEGTQVDIEGIASLVTNKPTRDWVDSDFDKAAVVIAEMSQRFNKLEAFARVKNRPDKRQAMAVVVGVQGIPTPLLEEFDISVSERGAVEKIVQTIDTALNRANKEQKHIILAALAELSARYMRVEQGQQTVLDKKR